MRVSHGLYGAVLARVVASVPMNDSEDLAKITPRLVALSCRVHQQTFKRLDVRGFASELVAKLVSLFHNLHRKH
jgi:hypothetical protein